MPSFQEKVRGSSVQTESRLTKAMTILALTCFLIVGAAATSILARDSMPEARMAIASPDRPLPGTSSPVSNKQNKTDRLAVTKPALALASLEPPSEPEPALSEPLRQAFTSSSPADIPTSKIQAAPQMAPEANPSATVPANAVALANPAAPALPKLAAKPAPQKTYTLLSDAQIAGIRDRLQLSSDQQSYWPAVENALRDIARKIHASRQANPNATGAPIIDPDCPEVQQLKSAAMPLLFGLREDQKREVRSLARIIGLERVAAQI